MKTRAQLLRMNADQLDEYVLSLCEEGYERRIDYEQGNWQESGHWELRFWNGEDGYTLPFEDKGELADYIIKHLQKADMVTPGNTRRAERKSRQVYFTLAENEQIEALLGGMEFSRWVRAKIAEEAAKQGKAFNNDLPEKGKYQRKV